MSKLTFFFSRRILISRETEFFSRCHFCIEAYPSYRGRCNWCIVSSVHCPRDANMLLDRFASTMARIVLRSLEILCYIVKTLQNCFLKLLEILFSFILKSFIISLLSSPKMSTYSFIFFLLSLNLKISREFLFVSFAGK